MLEIIVIYIRNIINYKTINYKINIINIMTFHCTIKGKKTQKYRT